MNTDAVRGLIENATLFAKCYTALTEALMAEGVPEDVARDEARMTALYAALFPEDEDSLERWLHDP